MDQKVEYEPLPFHSKNHPLKGMERYGPLDWKEGYELKADKKRVLKELQL